MACASVNTAALNLSGLAVASAVSNAASGATGSASSYPAHCQVKGAVNQRTGIDGKPYAIGYDMRLPAAGWNGKFFYAGDGGFGLDPQARADYGYHALGTPA